ncbi:MAG: type II toxin-antitoxin system RelE/ParE family toxin [Alphaproteobacteria bacterium]|nr:type II toxin-antitoxin system RelE/ParE family toxin [Alphaproteobacteria bacterium]MCW5742797.1 type II toxin-antitoxin system RelE/ParE family toxin [Alphaproteobacteria bacterium]
MVFEVSWTGPARGDVHDARHYYGAIDARLDAALVERLRRSERLLLENPLIYPIVDGDLRRAPLRQFPYALFYLVENNGIIVVALMHHKRRRLARDELVGA